MNVSSISDTAFDAIVPARSPESVAQGRQAKLVDAARKFEGMMLEELLKPMQHAGSASGAGFAGDDEDDPDRDPALDNFSSYGVEAMANALAKGGGIGIARSVLRQIGNVDEKGLQKSSSTKV